MNTSVNSADEMTIQLSESSKKIDALNLLETTQLVSGEVLKKLAWANRPNFSGTPESNYCFRIKLLHASQFLC